MARDFNGSNEQIEFGSDASIDNLHTAGATFAAWIELDSTATQQNLLTKSAAAQWYIAVSTGALLRLRDMWNASSISVFGNTTISTGTRTHVVLDFTASGVTARPNMYVNLNDETESVVADPTAPRADDSGANLRMGETSTGGDDLNGRVQNFCYDATVWDAGQRNRHKWWGRKGGAGTVCHPFYTDKLTNEGTGTANGTATGTTVASFTQIPPTMRPGSALMGMGVGW